MSAKQETLLAGADVRVRVMRLDAGEAVQWHRHSQVRDVMVCLEGVIEVALAGEPAKRLAPAQWCVVEPGSAHAVSAADGEPAAYLLAQGVGTYDFLPEQGE